MKTWFVWKKRKDNPAFIYQRWPIWVRTRLAMWKRGGSGRAGHLQIIGDLPVTTGAPVAMACCDEVYFHRFASTFAKSVVATCPNLYVHIHIYHPSPGTLEAMATLKRDVGRRLSFSYEPIGRSPYPSGNPYFFAAGRFAIADKILAAVNAPLLIMDIDGIVRRDLEQELAALENYDIGLIRRPWRKYPWRKILASAVLINPTPAGRLFASRLSSALERVLRSAPRFHIDQIVIFYLCEFYRRQGSQLQIADLGMSWADHLFKTDSLVWSAKGETRKLDLEHMGQSLNDVTG